MGTQNWKTSLIFNTKNLLGRGILKWFNMVASFFLCVLICTVFGHHRTQLNFTVAIDFTASNGKSIKTKHDLKMIDNAKINQLAIVKTVTIRMSNEWWNLVPLSIFAACLAHKH